MLTGASTRWNAAFALSRAPDSKVAMTFAFMASGDVDISGGIGM